MKNHAKHHGFAAIAAIFLVVGLAALGAFMVSFSNTQQLTSAQDVQGSRAFWAARGGLEWGISRALIPVSSCVASTVFVLDKFTVTVKCTPSTYADSGKTPGGPPPTISKINATAQSTGSPGSVGYIERSVSTSLEQ